uniref:Uncharacterized protein n=1 Tax=Arundo donax TaxID=35708 RepID=A0A0A9HDB0_ARUDO
MPQRRHLNSWWARPLCHQLRHCHHPHQCPGHHRTA